MDVRAIEKEEADDSGNLTAGEEEDEDDMDKNGQKGNPPLSVKDVPEDNGILPHDKIHSSMLI
ncbi:hypothetical protein RFI_15093 [Reticulomyxa filosa]|uniref:Uncharacterized protein n=1 Tax=Reticulomyxa filosa TaxID=46433 RepID=X6N9X7_RETFI|nr:hypothetical protein RFI_15093 [Reticulomyxa filosa]|eukprot:ETO22107.1 hypothetical protein RFI_15093 [Reticulomyxa filosa]